MGEQQLIQPNQSTYKFSETDINYLVGSYSPKILRLYLEKALYYNYDAEDDGSRKTKSLLIRAAMSNSLRSFTAFSLTSIGNAIGKDHATVLHQNKNHEVYYRSFAEYRTYYDHCAFIVKTVSKLVIQANNSYLDLSQQSIDYMEELKKEETTRKRKLEKLEGVITSIKHTLRKHVTHQEKIQMIRKTLKKKGDLTDPL